MKALLCLMLFVTAFTAQATQLKNQPITYVYEYDSAVDAKAIGSVDLRLIGVKGIQVGCAIESVEVYVQTAFTSGGSATVVIGNSVDDDGYLASIFSIASANAVIRSGQVAGALLWDDTNDAHLSYYVPTTVAAIPKLKIGTAALTAGKAKFIFTARCF